MRILVPIEFSEVSNEALEAAIRFGNRIGEGATLELLHVATSVIAAEPQPLPGGGGYPQLEQYMLDRIEDELRGWCARVRAAGLPCETKVIEGSPATAIVAEAAATNAAIIVMGTHGRRGFAHALIGSVAEKVVQRAPCPVLVVPGRAQLGVLFAEGEGTGPATP